MPDHDDVLMVSLREYLEGKISALEHLTEQRYSAQRDAVNAALSSSDKAIQKAELAAEKRFESHNEFREQLRDQASNLMPRAEAESRIAHVVEKIESLESNLNSTNKRLDVIQGQAGGRSQSWGVMVSVIVIVGILVGIVVRFL